jgi:hypothetical protein
MNMKFLFFSLIIVLFFVVSCEKEESINVPELDDEIITLVEDEIMADINFAELLDEGDDGIFWGDAAFSSLKSAELVNNDCRTREVIEKDSSRTVIFNFSNGTCGKSGTITIVYHKNKDFNSNGKKTVTYDNFTNTDGVIFNGTKNIKRGNNNYNIKAEMTITKSNKNGEVSIVRNYERQVRWICGLDTRGNNSDNIKKITGQSEITKTATGANGKEYTKSYSRKILSPLLIVKACGLKIQAGTVKVERANGTTVKIDYGKMPDEIVCGTTWENCNSTIEITKGDETFTVTFDENGNRIKPTKDE